MIHIYGLIDPRTCEIVYVGQSINFQRRLKEHIYDDDGGTAKSQWIAELKASGLHPQIVILDTATTKEEAHYKENWWILLARRQQWQSTNSTNPSEWRVNFGDMFSDHLRVMYEEHRQACERLNAEIIKFAIKNEKNKWIRRVELTVHLLVGAFGVMGLGHFVVLALTAIDEQRMFAAWILSAMWIAMLMTLYFFGKLRDADRVEGLGQTWTFNLHFGLFASSLIAGGIMSVYELVKMFNWGIYP